MSKQEEAGLILKLYELRREEVMRKARDWYFSKFNPESMDDIWAAMRGPESAYLRMVPSYWDMAASLVLHGAISLDMFTDAGGEHVGVFAKLEPFVDEIRVTLGAPNFLHSLEKLIDKMPEGRERTIQARERMKAMRQMMAKPEESAG